MDALLAIADFSEAAAIGSGVILSLQGIKSLRLEMIFIAKMAGINDGI